MVKRVIISILIIIIVAGLVVGALYILKQTQVTPTTDTSAVTVRDFSKDYEACSLIDSASIKQALGDSAANLQNPENMGIVGNKAIGSGVDDLASDSQICVYAFGPGGTLENGFNSGNAFTVERTVYSNEAGTKTFIDQIMSQSGDIKIDEPFGEYVFYSANNLAKGPGASHTFQLEVFTTTTSVKYMIHQPADSSSFTEETAKTALIQLAKLAKLPN